MGVSREVAAYQQTEVETASPLQLVVMLCDKLVADLKQVVAAIGASNIEERVKQSNHAFLVLQELELMLDFNNGGETAKELARVYSYVRAKLMESQIKLDAVIVERQIEFMTQLRQAWQQASATVEQVALNPQQDAAGLREGALYPYAAVGAEVQSCSWSA